MFEVSDIAIILICGATCLYCVVLGRRLSALQNTKDGLGAAIVNFSRSISEISSTTQATTAQAGRLALRLTELIDQAEAACKQAEGVSRIIEDQRLEALAELQDTREQLSQIMTEARQIMANSSSQPITASTDLFEETENRLAESLGEELRAQSERLKTLIQYNAS